MELNDFDDIVDLDMGSVDDSCYWLLEILGCESRMNHPYRLPYMKYVMSWKDALPIRAIVMAQSPYPRPIYSDTAAAMSFDEERCKEKMRAIAPPTVRVLANDLFVNAGLDREVTRTAIRDGWKMVSCGVLLVNLSVFESTNSGESFTECVNQVNVLCRLLRESEDILRNESGATGKHNVDLIAYGMGAIMASELTKCFKSDIIKLRKFVSDHPAHLSYKSVDFDDPQCHLNAPSTSKALARHISNYVAKLHTMPPVNESTLQLQRLRGLFHQYVSSNDGIIDLLNESIKTHQAMLDTGCYQTEEQVNAVKQHMSVLSTLSFRMSVQMSLISSTRGVDNTEGIYPARPGPSLQAMSPSQSSIFNMNSVGTVASPTQNTPRQSPRPVEFKSFGLGEDSGDDKESQKTEEKPKEEIEKKPEKEVKIKRKLIKKKRKDGTIDVVGVVNPDGTKEMFSSKRLSTIQESPVTEEFQKEVPEKREEITNVQNDDAPRDDSLDYFKSIDNFTLSRLSVNNLSCIDNVIEDLCGRDITDEQGEVLDIIGSDIINMTATHPATKMLATKIDSELTEDDERDLFDISSEGNPDRENSEIWKAFCKVFGIDPTA